MPACPCGSARWPDRVSPRQGTDPAPCLGGHLVTALPPAQVSEFSGNNPSIPGFLKGTNTPKTMNHFPHNPTKRAAASAVSSLGSVRPKRLRDVLWGQPLFKAPALPIPHLPSEPMPLIPVRVTRRPARY